MIRNAKSKALGSVVALAASLIVSTSASAMNTLKSVDGKSRRPNILLIIGDDIGIDATTNMYPGLIDDLIKQYGPSGFNHPDYKLIQGRPASTPTLDALSKAGMRFTQAWVQPFCSNTRASILTGLYPAKTGVVDYTGWLSQNQHSFVKDLKEKGGYSTAIFGKWHIAGLNPPGADPKTLYPGMKPKEAGFDLFLGNLNGALDGYWEYDYHIQDVNTPANQYRTETAPTRSLPGIAPTTYAEVVKISDTLSWLKDQKSKNPDKPWFAWLAFNLSHITAKQQPNPMAVPNIDTLDEPSRKEMQACGGNFGSANVGNCSDKALMRAMTNSLDKLVGILLKEVDALDPNTYVIYLADNGTWMFGNQREFIDNMYITRQGRGKGTAYESGARVEMAIRGPGIKAGSKSDTPVSGVDLFATILSIAGLDVPTTVPNRDGSGKIDLDGVSLSPILFNGAKQVRDPNTGYLLTETTNPIKKNLREVGARNAKYKLICDEKAEAASCLFFNLQKDPLEEYPLAKPESCTGYQNGKWTPNNQEWHFCRLREVIEQKSFLTNKEIGTKSSAAPAHE